VPHRHESQGFDFSLHKFQAYFLMKQAAGYKNTNLSLIVGFTFRFG
jgi:hypothetical protein